MIYVMLRRLLVLLVCTMVCQIWNGHNVPCSSDKAKGQRIEVIVSDREDRYHAREKCERNNLFTISAISVIVNSKHTLRNQGFKRNKDFRSNFTSLVKVNTQDTSSILTKFSLLNAQSLRNKSEVVNDYIASEGISICAITESWLNEDDTQVLNECCPVGYQALQLPRKCENGKIVRGGGLALISRSELKPKLCQEKQFESFELMKVELKLGYKSVDFFVLYRPPSYSKSLFLQEFYELCLDISSNQRSILLCGDFNLQVDIHTDSFVKRFFDILDMFGMIQHVASPTHEAGHIPDLIVTCEGGMKLASNPFSDILLSDHYAVVCTLQEK